MGLRRRSQRYIQSSDLQPIFTGQLGYGSLAEESKQANLNAYNMVVEIKLNALLHSLQVGT